MESPYYEMTHDFEEENRLFQSGYVKGYHDAVMKYPKTVRCENCSEYISKKEAVSRISDLLVIQLKGERQPTWNEVYHAIND